MKSSYWSGLRVLTWSVALLAAGSFAACTDDNDEGTTAPPPVALNNQIELNGADPVEIRSAIYEMDDEDAEWLCTRKLLDMGIDVEKWVADAETLS